ncbi:uncharacterized protein LOC141705840 [Apium graveolens]|uniref:uncharacterized protein LOC141705840 n=1 Tax=Apium graveolens TaxID=4045 RepID=UPI003D7B8B07
MKWSLRNLLKYAPTLVADEASRARRLEEGLRSNIRLEVAPFELQTYEAVLNKALVIERGLTESEKTIGTRRGSLQLVVKRLKGDRSRNHMRMIKWVIKISALGVVEIMPTKNVVGTWVLVFIVGRLDTRSHNVPTIHHQERQQTPKRKMGVYFSLPEIVTKDKLQFNFKFKRPMALSSARSSQVSTNEQLCYCGKRAKMYTSWSLNNPGRRFYTCCQPQGRCNYFRWYDPQTLGRHGDVITHLNNKRIFQDEKMAFLKEQIAMLEEKLASSEEKRRDLKKKNGYYGKIYFIVIYLLVVLAKLI